MNHPAEAMLALHAGGDLGPLDRSRIQRHLGGCLRCREQVARFNRVREMLPDLAEIPEVSWNRLAAEMRANIRLGLAAGECVRTGETPLRHSPVFAGVRAALAFASIIALMVTGIVLERPVPQVAQDDRPMVRALGEGIEVRGNGQALRLMHPGGDVDVWFTVGAQGTVGARYTDPKTGYMIVNRVYAE